MASNRIVLAGENVPPFEHRIVRKDGTLRWVRDTTIPRRDSLGQLASYDGVVRDITGVRRSTLDTDTHTLTLRDTPENVELARELLRDPYSPRRAAKALGAAVPVPVQHTRAW